MDPRSPEAGSRGTGPALENLGVSSPPSPVGKPGCRIRRDHSWMWLAAALLVLLCGIALLMVLLFWLPGLRY